MKVTDNLHMLRLGHGQAYLWCDADSVTLIDTGVRGHGKHVSHYLRTIGRDPAELNLVVLTHFHEDHSGSASELAQWPGVTIAAHRADAPFVRQDEPWPAPVLLPEEEALWASVGGLPKGDPCEVHRELEDGAVLEFGGGATIVHGPGHTPGSIGIFLAQQGVLFTGDTVGRFGDGPPMLGPFNLDRARAAESFRALAALKPRIACLGHGNPMTVNTAEVLLATAESL